MRKMRHGIAWLVGLAIVGSSLGGARGDGSSSPAIPQETAPAPSEPKLAWQTSYAAAMELAKERQQMLFLYFHRPERAELELFDRWIRETADGAKLAESMGFCHLPTDLKVTSEGRELRLLDHAAFAHMEGNPGVAMIDCVDETAETYGRVVSVYPVTSSRRLDSRVVTKLSQLPPGTLTQRSLVLAVALHRESPRSITGRWNPMLAQETQSHSDHQARIRVQGHHNWGNRFNRIVGRLGGALSAQEVCAESWPGQGLMDAAEECVASWRQSSGHWQAVSSPQAAFAYDMKQGSNGVWYATGIFAR